MLSERSSDDFHDVRFAGVKGRAVRAKLRLFPRRTLSRGWRSKVRGRFSLPRRYIRASRTELAGSLEGSESRVEPEVWCQCWRTELAAVSGVSVGQSVEERELWWTSASGGRVPVGGESPEVGTREGARWRTRGLHGYHSWGKGYVETTARESLPAPRRSAERALTR